MDTILSNHTPTYLETTFDSLFLLDHPLFSLLAEKTELPWMLIIPKAPLTQNPEFVASFYAEVHRLIEHFQAKGLGPLYNLAKIGNKNPNLHIHLIFREENDEVWPDAVWCHEPLKASDVTPAKLQALLEDFKIQP